MPANSVRAASALALLTMVLVACIAVGGEVTVTSKPTGATVFIDGKWAGTTPLTKPDLPPGKHLVKLSRFGYKPFYRTIETGAEPFKLDAQLEGIPRGKLKITSEPSDAEAYIDGNLEGKTPLTLKDFDAGEYKVCVRCTNYVAVTRDVTVSDGETTAEHFKLGRRSIEQVYIQRIKKDPDDLAACTELAHLYLVNGDTTKAIEVFRGGITAACGKDADAGAVRRMFREITKIYTGQFNYGDAEKRRNVRRKMGEMLEDVVEEEPENPYAFKEVLKLLTSSGRLGNVVALCNRMLEKNPKSKICRVVGEMCLDHGLAREAKSLLERAVKAAPDSFETRRMLGTTYHRLGMFDKAETVYAEAEKLAKSKFARASVLELRARLARRRGDYPKVVEILKEALELPVDPVKKRSYRLSMARALSEQGEFAEAERLCNELLEKAETSLIRNRIQRTRRFVIDARRRKIQQ